MRLQNKIAIITGAGAGIGHGIALAFAREGASVLLADLSEQSGQETAEQIHQLNGKAVFVKTDVSNAGDIDKMAKTCLEKFGRIDILVNNAGIARFGRLHETTEEEWDMVLNINLKAFFWDANA